MEQQRRPRGPGKTLSDEDRRRFHVILGKDAQGRTLVAYAPTALSDVMKWFGGNEFARLAGEYVRGQITFPSSRTNGSPTPPATCSTTHCRASLHRSRPR